MRRFAFVHLSIVLERFFRQSSLRDEIGEPLTATRYREIASRLFAYRRARFRLARAGSLRSPAVISFGAKKQPRGLIRFRLKIEFYSMGYIEYFCKCLNKSLNKY